MQSGLCLENIQTPLGLTSDLRWDLHGPPGVSRVYYQCVRGEKTQKCLVKHPQQYSDLFLSDYGWETS